MTPVRRAIRASFEPRPQIMMHLERSKPLQRKPDGFIVKLLWDCRKNQKNVASLVLSIERFRMNLERPGRIQQDRYWPFIHQFHLHHFLEMAGFAAQAGGLNSLDKKLI